MRQSPDLPATIRRLAKPAGFGNVVVEDAPLPTCGPRDVLIRSRVSLISRGSEILRRYMHEEAIDPAMMGYSVAGEICALGAQAGATYALGDTVAAVLPHAQIVRGSLDAMEGTQVWPVPATLDPAHVAFIPLVTGAVTWAEIAGIQPGDTVVVLGQGLVGNLVLQAARAYAPGCLVGVDALPVRCAVSADVGADVVINAADDDPVEAVKRLTDGKGADVVIDCVGGRAGVRSFAQAQEMSADGGTIHLIALYHGETLPLDAAKIQRRKLIGGYYHAKPRPEMVARAVEAVQTAAIRVAPLITHRFAYAQAKAAYDLLYARPQDALGVLLDWEETA